MSVSEAHHVVKETRVQTRLVDMCARAPSDIDSPMMRAHVSMWTNAKTVYRVETETV